MRMLNFRKIAKVAKNTQKQINLITNAIPKSPVSEQYRSIRTSIEFSAVDQEIKTIVVTSSEPNEGKSTTVANLAVTFAQQGKKVLIVDADLRLPTVHTTFKAPNMMGLTNVLTKQKTITEAVYKTEIKNLHVLSSGPIPPNPSELISSQSMRDFLEIVQKEYDIVLFDSPPLLAVADAQILANICQGIVMVISSGKTGTEKAAKAKEILNTAKGKLLGAVLNRKKMAEQNYYYYG